MFRVTNISVTPNCFASLQMRHPNVRCSCRLLCSSNTSLCPLLLPAYSLSGQKLHWISFEGERAIVMLVGKLRFGNKFRPRRGALSRFPVECFLKEGERLKIYSEPGAILFTIGSVSRLFEEKIAQLLLQKITQENCRYRSVWPDLANFCPNFKSLSPFLLGLFIIWQNFKLLFMLLGHFNCLNGQIFNK